MTEVPKFYRIRKDVRPYPGKLLRVYGEDDNWAWGYIQTSDGKYANHQRSYHKTELENVTATV